MMTRITPTHTKKNIDAIRLADTGLSLPTLSSRRYSITPAMNASTKLATAETIESFCKKPFLSVTQPGPPICSDRVGAPYPDMVLQ
jgi:hypothetical protein